MPNDSGDRYSKVIQTFIKGSIDQDYYIGFGSAPVGYADKSTRVEKEVANVSNYIKKINTSEISGVFARNDWVQGKRFKTFDYTQPSIIDSLCYNSSTKELYLCVGDTNYNNYSKRDSSAPSKFAPTGTAGTIIDMGDGYNWIKINYDPNPISENYIKITGIESLINFQGSTFDATGPTGGGATSITFGTCCLYSIEDWVEPVTGKTFLKGDIVAAYKVPNRWTCRYLSNQMGFEGVFLPSVTSTEFGGFFNISGTSGCTPCGATYANTTLLQVFLNGGSGGYTAGNIYRKNTDILTTIPPGCILSTILNISPTVTYYVNEENPKVYLETDGTLGSCAAYLKTEYINSESKFKVIGAYLTNQLTSSNCTYVEATHLETATITVSSGETTSPSDCLASLQFNLAPMNNESYLKIYDLLRVNKVGISTYIDESEILNIMPYFVDPLSTSTFLIRGLKNSSGYRIVGDGSRNYSKSPIKTSSTVGISSINGNISFLDPDANVVDFSDVIEGYVNDKSEFSKTAGSSTRQFVAGTPVSFYKLSFGNLSASTGTIEMASYDAYALTTGGTYTVQAPGGLSATFTITGVTASSINIQDSTVLFASDYTTMLGNIKLIFDI
jgi:hypothetical protein